MLAVTTRNRLRSPRFFLPMLWARRTVARQLAGVPGLIRYAGGVAGPNEFLTLTVWEDHEAMRRFSGSGAHERVMWLFSRWTASFWAMRWEPGGEELGDWAGLRLSSGSPADPSVSPLVSAGLLPPKPPRAGPLGPRPESGAVEPRAARFFGVTARLEGRRSLPAGARHRFRAEGRQNSALVRWTLGLDLPPQALVISLWRDNPSAHERALALHRHELGASWVMAWRPGDYEIGHWDRLRLRQEARRATRPGDDPYDEVARRRASATLDPSL
jgi:hypothetical protein